MPSDSPYIDFGSKFSREVSKTTLLTTCRDPQILVGQNEPSLGQRNFAFLIRTGFILTQTGFIWTQTKKSALKRTVFGDQNEGFKSSRKNLDAKLIHGTPENGCPTSRKRGVGSDISKNRQNCIRNPPQSARLRR